MYDTSAKHEAIYSIAGDNITIAVSIMCVITE